MVESAPSAKEFSCRQGKVGQRDKDYFCYSSVPLGYDMPHPSGPTHGIRGVRFFLSILGLEGVRFKGNSLDSMMFLVCLKYNVETIGVERELVVQ